MLKKQGELKVFNLSVDILNADMILQHTKYCVILKIQVNNKN